MALMSGAGLHPCCTESIGQLEVNDIKYVQLWHGARFSHQREMSGARSKWRQKRSHAADMRFHFSSTSTLASEPKLASLHCSRRYVYRRRGLLFILERCGTSRTWGPCQCLPCHLLALLLGSLCRLRSFQSLTLAGHILLQLADLLHGHGVPVVNGDKGLAQSAREDASLLV